MILLYIDHNDKNVKFIVKIFTGYFFSSGELSLPLPAVCFSHMNSAAGGSKQVIQVRGGTAG